MLPINQNTLRRAASWIFKYPVYFVLFPALAIAFAMQLDTFMFFLERTDRSLLLAVSMIPLLYGLLFLILTRPWFSQSPDRVFLPSVLAFFGLLHLVIFLIKPFYPIVSDFTFNHDAAVEMIQQPWRYAISHVNSFYKERALFYLYPLYLAFGPSLNAVRACNVAMLLAAGWLLYGICRMSLSDRRLARIVLVMFFIFPTRYLIANIQAHDISGIFYLALFFWIYLKLVGAYERDRFFPAAGWSLLLAVALAVVAIARTLYVPLLATLAVMTGYRLILFLPRLGAPRTWRRMACLLLFFLVIPAGAGKWSIAQFGGTQQWCPLTGALFTLNAAHGNGSAGDSQWYDHYFTCSREDMSRMGLGRMASEPYYNLRGMLQMFVRKFGQAQDTGQDLRWYLSATPGGPSLEWTIPTWFYSSILIVQAVQFLLGLLGLIWLARRPFTLRLQALPVFAFIFIILMELSQTQYRYTYTLHLFYALAAGLGARALCDLALHRRSDILLIRPRALFSLVTTVAVFLIGLFVIPPVFCRIVKNSDLLFVDLSKPAALTATGATPEEIKNLLVPITPPEKAPYIAALQLPISPAGGVRAEWEWQVKPQTNYRFKGYLNSATAAKGPLNLMLRVDGKEAFRLDGAEIVPFQYIDAGPFATGKDRVRISLEAMRAPVTTSTAPAQAIQVNLEFVMLTKDRKMK